MAEAVLATQVGAETVKFTADAAYSSGDVIQLRDGRAGVVVTDVASGADGAAYVTGVFDVEKTTSMVILPGSRLFWDHSANKCHLLHGNDRDFFLGVSLEDEASAATTARVDLNAVPKDTLSLGQGFVPVPVVTAGINHHIIGHGEGVTLIFDLTAEAQKMDALSLRGLAPAANPIVDALICVNTNGDDAAFDLNIGLASGTHATDADSIAESLFCHIDGNSTNIALESDDGTTEVAATDSTLDFTAGTPFLVQWDCRDLADIQVYVNGVNVLPASVFKLDAATGPLKLLAHMEKTANDTPGNVSVLRLTARASQF
jgi:predicted RecA/RadA family phage recombinase